jgi:hypothetical protein
MMNQKGQEEIIIFAVVFIALFFVGGFVGVVSLPEFPGRFYIGGMLAGIFGTGAGAFILKVVFHH